MRNSHERPESQTVRFDWRRGFQVASDKISIRDLSLARSAWVRLRPPRAHLTPFERASALRHATNNGGRDREHHLLPRARRRRARLAHHPRRGRARRRSPPPQRAPSPSRVPRRPPARCASPPARPRAAARPRSAPSPTPRTPPPSSRRRRSPSSSPTCVSPREAPRRPKTVVDPSSYLSSRAVNRSDTHPRVDRDARPRARRASPRAHPFPLRTTRGGNDDDASRRPRATPLPPPDSPRPRS